MQGFSASTKTTAYKKNVKENNLFQIKKFFCKLFFTLLRISNIFKMVKEKVYVGELIRKHIKDNRLTNGYVIKGLNDAGFDVSDTRFSNKIYGAREQFTETEVNEINKILETDFKL